MLINFIIILPCCVYLCLIFSFSYLFKLSYKLFYLYNLTSAQRYYANTMPQFLNPIELFWLYNSSLKSNNHNKSIGSCITFIEGNLSKNNLKNLLQTRIISMEQRTNQGFLIRFRQRLHRLWAYGYVWMDCDETAFNIDNHICEISNEHSVRNETELQDYMSHVLTNFQFDIDKPLWRVYYKHNYGVVGDKKTVLVFLFHMCFADGASLIRVFFKSLVDNRNAIELKPRFAFSHFKLEMLQHFFFSLNRLLFHIAFSRKDKNPLHRDFMKSSCFKDLNTLCSTAPLKTKDENSKNICKKVFWSEAFSLVKINRLKLITRTKFNDFLISVVAGVIRSYLQKKGS